MSDLENLLRFNKDLDLIPIQTKKPDKVHDSSRPYRAFIFKKLQIYYLLFDIFRFSVVVSTFLEDYFSRGEAVSYRADVNT